MNVSANSHATAGHDEKVVQPGSPGQTEQAAVGQGLSRRVSAQAPTSRQLADCEAGVTASERKAPRSLWSRCCRQLESWLSAGLKGWCLGALPGAVAGFYPGVLSVLVLQSFYGPMAVCGILAGGFVGPFFGLLVGGGIGAIVYMAQEQRITRALEKLGSAWTYYAQPDSAAGEPAASRSLMSRVCHKVVPWLDEGMSGLVMGAFAGGKFGFVLGAMPGTLAFSPPVAVAGAILGAAGGVLVGATIGCTVLNLYDEDKPAGKKKEQVSCA